MLEFEGILRCSQCDFLRCFLILPGVCRGGLTTWNDHFGQLL